LTNKVSGLKGYAYPGDNAGGAFWRKTFFQSTINYGSRKADAYSPLAEDEYGTAVELSTVETRPDGSR
jgi:hypothetical protein